MIQLVALPKASEASLSFPVRIMWRGRLNRPLPGKTDLLPEEIGIPAPHILSLQDDADFGIPVARTRWTVYLPKNLEAAPLRSVSKHNLSLSDTASGIDSDVVLQEAAELLSFIEQTVAKNRRQASASNLKQIGVAKNNLKQLMQRDLGQSRRMHDPDLQRRQSELAVKVQEAERIANEELSKSQELFDKNSTSSVTESLNEGLLIANTQQEGLQRSNRAPSQKAEEGGKETEFHFQLPQQATAKSSKSTKESVQAAPEQQITKSDARQQLRESNSRSISDLNTTVTDNAVSRQNRMAAPKPRMAVPLQSAPEGGTRGVGLGTTTAHGDAPQNTTEAGSQLWLDATQSVNGSTLQLMEPMVDFDADFNASSDTKIGNGIRGLQTHRIRQRGLQNAAEDVNQLIGQAQGAGLPGLGGGGLGGGGGGLVTNRRPAGGLSLDVELTKSGRALVFTKAGGDPKLALSIRPTSSSQWALRLVWSLAWGVIFFGVYYTLGKPEWKTRVPQKPALRPDSDRNCRLLDALFGGVLGIPGWFDHALVPPTAALGPIRTFAPVMTCSRCWIEFSKRAKSDAQAPPC